MRKHLGRIIDLLASGKVHQRGYTRLGYDNLVISAKEEVTGSLPTRIGQNLVLIIA
ncbi:hypothetical protein [Pontixanthobacter gangjinensis]|uniref:Uncharacterized protein n=1 Tax=Pontixanthobacter gangjinensis TaxID=1028742 RepID=A0A6I4SPS1_9SPHN|nr:hypothetical protein [Pontixanthobacter gangjinensis]MXO57388.1 hypothetical protein [Pontixanthobacter gangjinensis]